MDRLGIRSVYELWLMTDIPRPTLHRWLAEKVRFPIAGLRLVGDALSGLAGSDDPTKGIDAILRAGDIGANHLSLLAAECRARRVPYRRAIEAIRAAQLQIVPAEDKSA